jgi:hypothetical protein
VVCCCCWCGGHSLKRPKVRCCKIHTDVGCHSRPISHYGTPTPTTPILQLYFAIFSPEQWHVSCPDGVTLTLHESDPPILRAFEIAVKRPEEANAPSHYASGICRLRFYASHGVCTMRRQEWQRETYQPSVRADPNTIEKRITKRPVRSHHVVWHTVTMAYV